LLAYCERENSKRPDRKLIGGIIISEKTANVENWRYSQCPIKDTNDLAGWNYFNVANLDK
jgi:hypothetical protein